MTKSEAATFLDVSEKTITRHVSSGKLPARYIAGKTGKQLEFDRDDLERFKLESAAPVEANGNVGQPRRDETTALVPTQAITPVTPSQSAIFAELVRAIIAETRQDKTLVPTSDKLALSLDEAAALSGVSRGVLDAGRRDGQLKARKIGRGYKVLRRDLEQFVERLFSDESEEVNA